MDRLSQFQRTVLWVGCLALIVAVAECARGRERYPLVWALVGIACLVMAAIPSIRSSIRRRRDAGPD